MLFRVFEEKKSEEKKDIFLRLVNIMGGDVLLEAVDERGNALPLGNLLMFYEGGKVRRVTGVNSELGFSLDSEGRIQVE